MDKIIVRCTNCGTGNDEDADFCKKCSTRLKPEVKVGGKEPSGGLLIVFFLAGLFLSMLGVILTVVVAVSRKDDVGKALLFSILGMFLWILLWVAMV